MLVEWRINGREALALNLENQTEGWMSWNEGDHCAKTDRAEFHAAFLLCIRAASVRRRRSRYCRNMYEDFLPGDSASGLLQVCFDCYEGTAIQSNPRLAVKALPSIAALEARCLLIASGTSV
jgi:hypothetical protein